MKSAANIGRVTFVITLLAGVSASAMTFNHVSKCQVSASGGSWTWEGQFDNTSTASTELWCPIDYTLGSAPTSVTASVFSSGCQVWGGVSTNGQQVRVCVGHAGGAPATCPAYTQPPTCDVRVWQLNTSVPSSFNPNSGDYLFLDVQLLPANPANRTDNTIFGYTIVP